MRVVAFCFLLVALCSALPFPCWSDTLYSTADSKTLSQIIETDLTQYSPSVIKLLLLLQTHNIQSIQALERSLLTSETLRQENEKIKLQLLNLSVLSEEDRKTIDALLKSYGAAKWWNDAWPWITVGVGVICIAGGIWIGAQF